MEYTNEEKRLAYARYLARMTAAILCAPDNDDDEEVEEDEE